VARARVLKGVTQQGCPRASASGAGSC
jgi:hypothetical protein